MSQEYLTTPIEVVPDDMRSALGICQSDIVVRTAIVAGLADLREHPDLLRYVFASLPKDGLTFRHYGEEQVELAKKWFLSTDIPVFMNTRIDESKLPCITVGLSASAETSAVLGDVNSQTSEIDYNEDPIIYGGPYIPLTYNATTGVLQMNSSFDLDVFPGQYVKDAQGGTHEILEVQDATTIVVAPNLNVPFSGMYIISAPQARRVSLEVVEFRETYEIGCHVIGEPVYLSYLHSILIFILLRYKEALLEARGLERTTISAGPVLLNTSFPTTQPVFTRNTSLNGFVFQYWPKFFTGIVDGVIPRINTVPSTGVREINEDGTLGAIYDDDIVEET